MHRASQILFVQTSSLLLYFFQRILNELREDSKARLMQTKNKESDLREELYYEFHALRRIEEKLNTYHDRKVFFRKKGE